MKFDKLYYMGAKNALYEWTIWTEGSMIYTRHGQVHGKLQTSIGKRCLPKNVGRSNATTAIEQAEREAQSMFDHKLKIKYARTPAEANVPRFLPMLAHNFKKHHNGLSYPVFVQRKYDGFRCIISKEDGEVMMYSREGEPFELPHIARELEQYIPDGYVLDGEIYRHGVPFQRIASWIKRSQPDTLTLKIIIYDVPEADGHDDLEMKDRVAVLEVLRGYEAWKNVEIAPTYSANNHQEVLDFETKFITEKYEGAIVRTQTGKYQYERRSYGLLKVKTFEDAEFKVHGAHAGSGKFADLCIFECFVDPGKPATKENLFNVVPLGSETERREYLKNAKKYKGQFITVKFQGKSEAGKPRFPVAKGFRPAFDKKLPKNLRNKDVQEQIH